MIGALFLGILEGSQWKIKKIHRRGAKDAEKCRSFICPDEPAGQMKGVPLPKALDFGLRDPDLGSVMEWIDRAARQIVPFQVAKVSLMP
jgi:hypothetical protein